jgi:nucleoside 2-deoxyribosyltransferase
MGTETKCMLCGSNTSEEPTGFAIRVINCDNCGEYAITYATLSTWSNDFLTNELLKGKQHLIAGYVHYLNESGAARLTITRDKALEIIRSGQLPSTIQEKLDKLLLWVYKKSDTFMKPICIDFGKTAIAYAHDENEFKNMVLALVENGYIKSPSGITDGDIYSITIKGINHIEAIEQKIDSKQCFVAMWFNDELMEAFQSTISRAIVECGFSPLIISMREHNGNINDQIIAEIRKSRFIIADFTGHRGGVYFEAGFAMGLGKQVIWTCRKDYFNKMKELEEKGERAQDDEGIKYKRKSMQKIHFDVEHYNFIVWSDEAELFKKLKDRIGATIA